MALVEEMQSPSRPTPGILKTIEAVMSVVRQSREETPVVAAAAMPVQASEIRDLFKSDLTTAGPQCQKAMTHEEKEAADLARIRAALYA